MKKTDIDNYNTKGQRHGYQEWYHYNDEIRFRGNYKNGRHIAYIERHNWKITKYKIT